MSYSTKGFEGPEDLRVRFHDRVETDVISLVRFKMRCSNPRELTHRIALL